MKIPDRNMAWFLALALSLAIHAALLLAYKPAMPTIGHTGHVVRLSIERTGHHNVPPDIPARVREGMAQGIPQEAATPSLPQPVTAPPARVAANTRQPAAMPAGMTRVATPDPDGAPALPAPPSPAVVAGSTQPSPRESAEHLRHCVLELFSQRIRYPAIARRKGWEGTVTLQLLIEADGRISRLQVHRTSGYPVLDRAAVESLQLASLPQAQHWLHGRAIELLVPVEYRLLGG